MSQLFLSEKLLKEEFLNMTKISKNLHTTEAFYGTKMARTTLFLCCIVRTNRNAKFWL